MAENKANETKVADKRRERAESAAKSKRKEKLIMLVVALCVVLCVVLTVLESNFIYRKISAAKVNDTTYSVAEYNWMYTKSYVDVYSNLYNTYGSYISYVLDTSKPLSEQQYSEDQTWDEFLKEYTNEALINLTCLYDEAVKAGWEPETSVSDMAEADWESLKETAESNGTDAASYAYSFYGKGVSEKLFKAMDEKYYYAYSYGSSVREGIEISDDDISAEYKENPNDYDMISYKYYYVNGTAADGQDETEALAAAKETAEAIKTAEDMDSYVETELSDSVSKIRSQPYDNISDTYADWLFDSARVSGDREVFDGSTGYYVIEFTEKQDLHYNMVNVRHILVSPEDSSSDSSWEEAYAKANEYVETINQLGGGEDNFSAVAKAYSEDTGSQSIGGLYENIYKGQMEEEFENWCFDSSRKEGDMDIIKTTYGYHIMYFVSEGEEYYTYTIDSAVRSERYTEIVEGYCEGAEVTELSGFKYAGAHLA